mmetsp:Transcript_98343/g.219620  ORF Transcript_98343/g.219620 Transcript_98343/m.219620 type:complete len:382 (+) Transcript_98343:57-1202(+)
MAAVARPRPVAAGSKTYAGIGAADSQELKQLLTAARPKWSEKELVVVLWKLSKVQVHNVAGLRQALTVTGERALNERLKSLGHRCFTLDTIESLCLQAKIKPFLPAISPSASQAMPTPRASTAPTPATTTPRESTTPAVASEAAPSAVAAAGPAAATEPAPAEEGTSPAEGFPESPAEETVPSGRRSRRQSLSRHGKSGVRRWVKTAPKVRPQYFKLETSSSSSCQEDEEEDAPLAASFSRWLNKRRPAHRFDHGGEGLAWDFPLANDEKRELLLLQVLDGELEARGGLHQLRAAMQQQQQLRAAPRNSPWVQRRSLITTARRPSLVVHGRNKARERRFSGPVPERCSIGGTPSATAELETPQPAKVKSKPETTPIFYGGA